LAAWKGPERDDLANGVDDVSGNVKDTRSDSKVKVQAKMQYDGRWFGVVGSVEL
jgi:hypothetical protein